MGEVQQWLLEPTSNRAVKVQAINERLTSDAHGAARALGAVAPFWQALADCLARWQLPPRFRPRGPRPRAWIPPPHAHRRLVLRE